VLRLPLSIVYAGVLLGFALINLALRPGCAAALARHADRTAGGRLSAMQYLPILLMFVLFAANIPVAFGMAVAALSFFLFAPDLPIAIFVQRLVSVTESFPLLAVPFFIMAGAIMNYAGITRRLMALADAAGRTHGRRPRPG